MARKVTRGTGRTASTGKAKAAKPVKTSTSAKPTADATETKPATPPFKGAATVRNTPTSREQIDIRAYEIWLRKDRPMGQDEQNWFEAEAELKLQAQTR